MRRTDVSVTALTPKLRVGKSKIKKQQPDYYCDQKRTFRKVRTRVQAVVIHDELHSDTFINHRCYIYSPL